MSHKLDLKIKERNHADSHEAKLAFLSNVEKSKEKENRIQAKQDTNHNTRSNQNHPGDNNGSERDRNPC